MKINGSLLCPVPPKLCGWGVKSPKLLITKHNLFMKKCKYFWEKQVNFPKPMGWVDVYAV